MLIEAEAECEHQIDKPEFVALANQFVTGRAPSAVADHIEQPLGPQHIRFRREKLRHVLSHSTLRRGLDGPLECLKLLSTNRQHSGPSPETIALARTNGA
jgi:hypothetical protein